MTGELDLSNVAELRTHLREAALDDSVVLDFSALAYLDSTSINVLMNTQLHLVRDGGTLVIAGASPMVRRILNVLELGKTIPMFETVEQGVAYLRTVQKR